MINKNAGILWTKHLTNTNHRNPTHEGTEEMQEKKQYQIMNEMLQ
jgi:hypothetical protein